MPRAASRGPRRRADLDAFRVWVRRTAPVVTADETGWKVGGQLQWLWVFVTPALTIYAIQPGRGFAEAAQILGADFAGTLVRDGWSPYRRFQHTLHQTCLGHLLRRCHEILDTAVGGSARFPRAVKALLQDALALRDRHARGELSPHGLTVARGQLEARCDRLLAWQPTDEANRKLAAHLVAEGDALFPFLYRPEIPATNCPRRSGSGPSPENPRGRRGSWPRRGSATSATGSTTSSPIP